MLPDIMLNSDAGNRRGKSNREAVIFIAVSVKRGKVKIGTGIRLPDGSW